MMRTKDRKASELRPVTIITDYTEMAAGSVLIECGKTRVICTASVEEGVPPFLKGKGQGWLTAEYAMLPGATPNRKPRDGIKKDGRSVEISRLIGRSLRAACDMTRIGERTITLDCDVISADGGTRAASITGAFVALCLASERLLERGVFADSPVVRQLAAVSAGIVEDEPLLDLEYAEDSRAEVDLNLVMLMDEQSGARFVEVQGAGEGRAFSRDELNAMLEVGEKGILTLMDLQREALGDSASVIGRKPKLVIASGNFNKLREIRRILADRFDVISMKEMGVEQEIEETGETFEQNALIKAEALMKSTGCACLADDSGLEVDALNGRPGVRSARYAGVHGDDEANNCKLLEELSHTEQRGARYVCAMALCTPGKKSLVARGECAGEILREHRGDGGFGYDPLFLSTDLGITFAEASAEVKDKVSHRSRAIEALLQMIRN